MRKHSIHNIKDLKESDRLHSDDISIDELLGKCIENYKIVEQNIIIANKELVFQNKRMEQRAAALIVSHKNLIVQNEEKEKRAAELVIANIELAFQNEEKEKRAAELIIAHKELVYQNEEKGKRAAELIIANKELAIQNDKKEIRAAELIIANKELAIQNDKKEKRSAELIIAHKELVFQNDEKEKRAAELIIANLELAFQNKEKVKRAAELIIANKELVFQNEEKEKRAAELIIANKELVYQNEEKGKRAAELIIANKELAFQNKEKEKRAEDLIRAKKLAEDNDMLKSAFLANMSHEIRTPMNGILGFTQLLKKTKLTEERQLRYINMIEKGGARMLNIINDLIDISKIEAGQTTVANSLCNINEQIKYIYSFFKPEVESKGMHISYQYNSVDNGAIIQTDREKLLAIMTNLVKNAIKYSDSGSIEIGYSINPAGHSDKKHDKINSDNSNILPYEIVEKPVELTFFVKDTGIGIPNDKIETIFNRFVQVDSGFTRSVQGAGLGLAISKAYVEMLGGKIWVESKKGKGSAFYFTISDNSELRVNKAINNIVSPEAELEQLKSLKVLIVEDDELSALFVSEMVKDYCKEVLHASNGKHAIETCHDNPDIDLVLMDIQMPGMNGYEATQQIRAFNQKVIIIAQTANALSGDKEKAIAAGCNNYIPKPIEEDLLYKLIEKYFSVS